MTVTRDVWTCPTCNVTEHLVDGEPALATQRQLVQLGHAERHRAESARSTPLTEALLDALRVLAAFRVRLVVAPGDLERMRELVKRRGVPIEVFAGDLQPGHGYVMTPRRGVRELSTPGENPGDNR